MQVALLARGVARTIAVDVDAGFLEETRIRASGDPRLELVHAPMENCGVPDDSVDVVMSAAVFEHLSDVPSTLEEVRRILRPGGLMFVKVGQPWLHFNGPHLITYIHVPWLQLFFREATILAVLDRFRTEGAIRQIDRCAGRGSAAHEPVHDPSLRAGISRERNERPAARRRSPRSWKARVGKLPLVRELLAGSSQRCCASPLSSPYPPREGAVVAAILAHALRVLVTGGAGFIGSHLVAALLRRGDDVRVLDNFSTGFRGNLDALRDDFELLEGDLRSYERVHNAVRGCDFVLHQGALPSVPRSVQDPLTSSEINVGGTLNVLLNARDEGVRRVVVASSSSVYGDTPGLPRVETMAASPLAPYAVSKLAAEQYALSFHRVYGLETAALRYFNVFGPRQDPNSHYSAVIPKFIVAQQQGESPVIYGDGEQSRDFTFIDDVVQANLLAMDAPGAAGRAFNVACGRQRSLNELVATLNSLLGTQIEPTYSAPRPGDVQHSLADISLARELLGYEPAVGFEDGLERTADAYLAAGVAVR